MDFCDLLKKREMVRLKWLAHRARMWEANEGVAIGQQARADGPQGGNVKFIKRG